MFIYRAKQHLSLVEHEHATLGDAIKHAAAHLEWGAGLPQDVIDESGTVVLGHDELNARAEALTVPHSTLPV